MAGTVMKHGVDVQVGPHRQRVIFGKAAELIVKVAEMRRQEAVRGRAPPRVMKRRLKPTNVNAQEDGVAKINHGVFLVDWVNKQLCKRRLAVNLKELLKN
jgi:hypothetical protein